MFSGLMPAMVTPFDERGGVDLDAAEAVVERLAMIIGPLLHVALTAATKGRYYEPADAGANRAGDR